MVRPTSWLPLAVLALLVGLTLWLNALVQAPSARASGALRHDPDLMVENFSARKLDESGRVLYTLTARKMVHYPDDDSALLESVTVEAFEPRQPKMTATADHGRLEQGGDRVWVEGNVVVVREADEKNERARLTTDKLLVLPDSGIARTTSDVVLENASGRAHAKGMELDNRARTMKLDQVTATYKPPRKK
ncbi:MAG TPA: LPS export ABC transporter periplasmic protein LptC [Usitatibacter sp.]|jgi:lipopolysaccharide export system protein LptC|nr:LPS export ABC transporter periplasmic protein LptC [Usitatibacter sp.]